MRPATKKIRQLTAGLALAGVLGAACSGGSDRPEVAAVVEGMEVPAADTEGLTDAYLDRYVGEPEKQEPPPRDRVTKLVLDYQIKLALLEHAAHELGVKIGNDKDLDEAADYLEPETFQLIGERRQDFVNELRAGRLSKALAGKLYPDISVPEDALRAEYERRGPVLARNWKASTKVARFSAEASVGQLRDLVERGASFEEAASKLGARGVAAAEIDPLAAPLAPAVLDAIGQVPEGKISEAIPAGGEFLAVLVEARQQLPRMSMEDLRADLTATLAEQQRYRQFQEWFGKQLATAKVRVDDHYGEWNPELGKVV